MIIIVGPTAVGKSSFALKLAHAINGVIINGDMGQLYAPLSIGTARPLVCADGFFEGVPHHLYGVERNPVDWTAVRYRDTVDGVARSCLRSGRLPIIVGGSHFYIRSLLYQFFSPNVSQSGIKSIGGSAEKKWDALNAIDPIRAQQIHVNDSYRIERALSIWNDHGILPSLCAPQYKPIRPYIFVFLDRDKEDLEQRSKERIDLMVTDGWLEESRTLFENAAWKSFVSKKGFIGYKDLFDCISTNTAVVPGVKDAIQLRTMQYIKTQKTFVSKLTKEIKKEQNAQVFCYNLTLCSDDLYLKQLCSVIDENKDVFYAE